MDKGLTGGGMAGTLGALDTDESRRAGEHQINTGAKERMHESGLYAVRSHLGISCLAAGRPFFNLFTHHLTHPPHGQEATRPEDLRRVSGPFRPLPRPGSASAPVLRLALEDGA